MRKREEEPARRRRYKPAMKRLAIYDAGSHGWGLFQAVDVEKVGALGSEWQNADHQARSLRINYPAASMINSPA